MQRRDNPEMALAAAARDQAEFTRDLRRSLPTFDIPYSDNGFDVSKVTKKSAVFLTIGTRGDLTKQQAKTAAEMFLKIRKRAGPEMVCLRLAGWNDDRRETCE